jgi:hypothetical protein
MRTSLALTPQLIIERAEANTRPVCLVLSALWAILTIGLYRGADWATWIWPWDDPRMTYVFLSSITVAVAAPLLWIAIIDEAAAAAGLALDAVVITGGMTITYIAMGISRSEGRLFAFAAASAISGVLAWAVFQSARHLPSRDQTPLPRFVRFAYAGFIVVLLIIGTALIFGADNTFPWDLPNRTSVIYGGIFMGAGAYFAFGIARNTWVHGGGQLAGFLAYDLVLLSPYLRTLVDENGMSGSGGYQSFPTAGATAGEDVNRTSLWVYTGFLVLTSLIAIYFLFINPATRIWRHLGIESDRRPMVTRGT